MTGGLLLGGATTFLVNLGAALNRRGESLQIVSFSDLNEMERDFAANGIPIWKISPRANIYEDRLRLACRHLAPVRPRAVIACLGSESFEVLRAVPPGVARIGVIQSDDPGPYGTARRFAPWLDAIVGVSATIQRKLRDDPAFAGVRAECIPYGINFGPATPRAPRNPAKPIRLIYVGRVIEEQKRVSRLVELVNLLAARQLPFEFTFAGSGPQLSVVRTQLEGRTNVRFLGEIPNQRVRALLDEHDVLVLLSDYEGLPLSLLEAMGQGVVPVVSDLESGLREVVSSETGIRVPVGDVPVAAEAIVSLARDSGRLAGMSEAGSQLARSTYSADIMADRYLKLAAALAPDEVVWPSNVVTPAPLMDRHAWLYRGLPRHARRWVKRVARIF